MREAGYPEHPERLTKSQLRRRQYLDRASAAEPATIEKGLFLGGGRAAECAVPVRETPETADDIRVDFGMPQTVGISAAAKEGDTAFLIGEVL